MAFPPLVQHFPPGPPSLEASKWLQSQVLIDAREMELLFESLGAFAIYKTGIVVTEHTREVSKDLFLKVYFDYVNCLKKGGIPDETSYRSVFSSVFTCSSDAVSIITLGEDKQILRVVRPVVQLQAHRMHFSSQDGKFRPMVFGPETILWGIQFSYPQLCIDSFTRQVRNVTATDEFPNTRLFHQIQKWVRYNTIPTPFLVEGSLVNIPVRLGKECLGWINSHPHLVEKGLFVKSKT
jgi:hypothetical protein